MLILFPVQRKCIRRSETIISLTQFNCNYNCLLALSLKNFSPGQLYSKMSELPASPFSSQFQLSQIQPLSHSWSWSVGLTLPPSNNSVHCTVMTQHVGGCKLFIEYLALSVGRKIGPGSLGAPPVVAFA